jgi:ribosomal protein S27E
MATLNPKAFPFSDAITCPGCKKSITLYDHIGCEAAACPSCYSYLLFGNDGKPYVKERLISIQNKPVLPIGTEGVLRDVEYKVIAYIEKKEAAYNQYQWREYMLYNYAKGYAFLAEYDGHWSLIAGKTFHPDLEKSKKSYENTALYQELEFNLFNSYRPVIHSLIGEFDWDIREERIKAQEYIRPPFLLTWEQNLRTQQEDWYLGEYIEVAEIADCFKIPAGNFPSKVGIGANQPSKHRVRWNGALTISGIAIIAFLLVQLWVGHLRPETVLLEHSFSLDLPPRPADTAKNGANKIADSTSRLNVIPDSAGASVKPDSAGNFEFKSFKTPTFKIEDGPVPLEIELSSQVDNNWLSTTVELVSEKDNQTWSLTKDIEYYHGVEDGESWSEGGIQETVLLSEIPPGKYHINMYPYSGTRLLNALDVKVTESVTLWRNILVTLLLLCLYPLYCWYRARRFEVSRWMNSDFSPYQKDDDE